MYCKNVKKKKVYLTMVNIIIAMQCINVVQCKNNYSLNILYANIKCDNVSKIDVKLVHCEGLTQNSVIIKKILRVTAAL